MSMKWARHSGAAILAMDAMQVYRGADIGTGKPTAAERAKIPHGGLNLVEFGENFDVARYLEHATTFLREQRETGRRVIIVGGTGLYFRALTQGLCDVPQGSDELRAELNALSVEHLRERLEKIDPAMLERLDSSNPRRLIRAIEVKEETGRSLQRLAGRNAYTARHRLCRLLGPTGKGGVAQADRGTDRGDVRGRLGCGSAKFGGAARNRGRAGFSGDWLRGNCRGVGREIHRVGQE